MVRTKEEGTGAEEVTVEKTEPKSRTLVKNKEKPHVQSLVVDKSSFNIGFIIGTVLLCMFIVGCIVGSAVMWKNGYIITVDIKKDF